MSFRQRPRCARNADSGSVAVGFAIIGLVVVLAMGVGAVGAVVAGHAQMSNAADAAALAAAPVTFRSFGARGTPVQEAARFASANGARLLQCDCVIDRSWNARTVRVVVGKEVSILGIGVVHVEAMSRATFEPARLIPPG